MAEDKRNIQSEFYSILTPKDCGRFSKTAKSNYEDAVSKLEYTYKSLLRKLNNEEYTKYQPEVDDKVVGYYESIIGAFQSAVRNFVKTGKWSYTAPSTSEATKTKFNTFMEDHNKHGSYFDGRPETVSKSFDKMVKNLTKNNFSISAVEDAKKAEEEAKKPKIEKVNYERFDSYDPKRMQDYKPSGRGEQMAISAFLTNRHREAYEVKRNEEKYPEIREYFNKLFTALDNAWFSYVSGTVKKLDLSEADAIYEDYTKRYSTVRQFDNKVCAVRMAYGGSYTYWDCKNALYKAETAREKVVKTITMEKENTYETWEKSIDAILNDEGKPSLNAFLDNWVEEVVAYYLNPANIKMNQTRYDNAVKRIKDLDEQIKEIADKWVSEHTGEKGVSWWYIRNGYENIDEYTELSYEKTNLQSTKKAAGEFLSISKLGEAKIRKMFKEQAAAVKKSFVTAVCEKSGPVKDGVFYWSAQNTGHLNGTVVGQDGSKWRVTSFFAGGWNIMRLHVRTKITKLVR